MSFNLCGMFNFKLCLIFCVFFIDSFYLLNISNYIPSSHLSFCTRKLNLTNQVGCASKLEGNYGIVVFNISDNNLEYFVNNTDTFYVLALDVKTFIDKNLMQRIRMLPNVQGVLVFYDILQVNENFEFSESSTCPNSQYSFYNSTRQCSFNPQWNKYGSDYSSIDWPFPVVLVQDPNMTTKVI